VGRVQMKNILVLARDDVEEAMRVAAGLTIFGHQVECVVVAEDTTIQPDNEQLELLELAEIVPSRLERDGGESTGESGSNVAAGFLPAISCAELSTLLAGVDVTMSF